MMQVLHLERGRTRCTIVPEAGGRLHQLELFDGRAWLPLLHSTDDLQETLAAPTMSGSFAMVPWPNRIAGGIFEFEGKSYELPSNHHGHAIHGFGFDRPWQIESSTSAACRLTLDFGDAWPFGGRAEGQAGSRNGYERGRLRTAEGPVEVAVPQVRGAGEPFRSALMGFLEGNSDVLERLVVEMYARGLSARDIEDAFRDVTGELLISRSAVSEITGRLSARAISNCRTSRANTNVASVSANCAPMQIRGPIPNGK